MRSRAGESSADIERGTQHSLERLSGVSQKVVWDMVAMPIPAGTTSPASLPFKNLVG